MVKLNYIKECDIMEKNTTLILKRVRLNFDPLLGKVTAFEWLDNKCYGRLLSPGIYKAEKADVTEILGSNDREMVNETIKGLKAFGYKKVSAWRYHPNIDYLSDFKLFEMTSTELVYRL